MRHLSLTQKILFTALGLSAVALPVFFIAINFQPLGFLINNKNPAVSPTPTTPAREESTVAAALLTEAEYTDAVGNSENLVIYLDSAAREANGLSLTTAELNELLNTSSPAQLRETFRSKRLILVGKDIQSLYSFNSALKKADFEVALYLTDE